jgi:deoxyribonuclease V
VLALEALNSEGMSGMVLNERLRHPWNVSRDVALVIQNDLRRHVVVENRLGSVKTVAGVDVGFPDPQTARAAVVVLSFPVLEPLDYAIAQVPVTFPYIPGLLSFREMPAVLVAMEKLQVWPDLFIFDAQGLAHPRRLGLASHAGLLLNWPSIGCAQSRLTDGWGGMHREGAAHQGWGQAGLCLHRPQGGPGDGVGLRA